MIEPFPQDVGFIQNGRMLEIEAVEHGMALNEFSTAPDTGPIDFDDEKVAFEPVDDIQETDERLALLSQYVTYSRRAFDDRGMTYPFKVSEHGDSLCILPGCREIAEKVAELGRMVSVGNPTAKRFEVRATTALHRLVGGWAVCVGAPRKPKSKYAGVESAISGFRGMLSQEVGGYFPGECKGGDFGADAIFILGRAFCGPLLFLQAKNAPYNIHDIPEEFLRTSDILCSWFGRKIDGVRDVVRVFAVNTVFTNEFKERAFQAGGPSGGCHIIDAVDILLAESPAGEKLRGAEILTIM